MKFIDWFAGIGGFRRGMELAGHECVGFCEFDKYAVMSYTAMHLCTQEQLDYLATLPLKQRQKEILKDEYKNGEWYADDVRRVDAGDIPEADCWCFGFPCQDISVAGKQAGFNGTRSSLFFEVMRLLDERKANGFSCPGYLFIENVKNLLSINGGIDFAKVLFALDERGYDAEWQVLNSKNFNVPQNRERVFVVGHLRGRSTTEVFPVERADGADCVYGVNQIGSDGRSNRINPNQYRVYDPDGISPCLNQMGGGGREPHIIDPKYYKLEGGVRVYENCTPTLTSRDYKDPLMVTQDVGINPTLTCNKNEGNRVAIPVLTPEREKKRQNGRRFKEDGEEAFTLTGQDRHGVAVGIDDLYAKREPRFYDEEVPTLRSDRYGLKAAVKVEPVEMSGNKLSESDDTAHTLNANDQRKMFGAHQSRTMVGYNATLKEGGGMTQTALALNARNYKGLSGSKQMMTAAAMCLQLTKDTNQKNEKSQTASNPEKTEGCQSENRKEH